MRTEHEFRWRWIVLPLAGILALGGGIYLVRNSPASTANRKAANPAPSPISPLTEGRQIFGAYCVACHQPNGRGLPGVYPPLAGSEWLAGGEGRVIRIVLNGMNGPVEINGEKFNNLMIPFRDVLSDAQIAQVLTFVRQEWGNSVAPITPENVTEIRKVIAGRGAAWTAPELLEFP